jgi:YesN/AraC family two-component response regulator
MKRILIIDDDEFILFGLSKAIAMHSKEPQILTARHGKQALEILQSHQVDLVVTDLKMPIMNGYQVVDYVNKFHPCLPVFVMTGDYLPDVKPRFRDAVVSQFVSKPFSFRQAAVDIMRTLAMIEQPAAV